MGLIQLGYQAAQLSGQARSHANLKYVWCKSEPGPKQAKHPCKERSRDIPQGSGYRPRILGRRRNYQRAMYEITSSLSFTRHFSAGQSKRTTIEGFLSCPLPLTTSAAHPCLLHKSIAQLSGVSTVPIGACREPLSQCLGASKKLRVGVDQASHCSLAHAELLWCSDIGQSLAYVRPYQVVFYTT